MGFPKNRRSTAHPKRTNGSADLLAWLVGIKLTFFDRSNSTYAVHHPLFPCFIFHPSALRLPSLALPTPTPMPMSMAVSTLIPVPPQRRYQPQSEEPK